MNKLFFIYGKEDFLIDGKINEIRKSIDKAAGGQVAVEDWQAADLDWEKLVGFTLGGGLFSSMHLVIIRNFDELELDDKEEAFGKIASALPDSLALVLVQEAAPKNNPFYNSFIKRAQVFEYQPFAKWQEAEIDQWINGQVKLRKKTISQDAVELLADTAGQDLRALSQEIDKLATYVGEKTEIDFNDVSAVASEGELDIFNLVEALKGRKNNEALVWLNKALKNNEEPVRILGLIANQFRGLVQLKSLSEKNKDEYSLAQKLGMKPFVVKKNLPAANRFKTEELVRSIDLMHDADLKIKTGRSPKLTLELLVTQICQN